MNFDHLCPGPFPLASRRGIVPVSRLGIVPSVLPPAFVAGRSAGPPVPILPPAFPLDLAADPTTSSSRRKFELWCQPQRASHFVVPSLFGSQRRWVPAPQLDAASTFRGFPRDRHPPFNQIFHPISLPTTFVSKPARLTPSRSASEAYWVRRSLTGRKVACLRHSSDVPSTKFCHSPARLTPSRSASEAYWVRRSLTGSADTLLRHSSSRSSIKFCQSPARVTPVRSTCGAHWVRR